MALITLVTDKRYVNPTKITPYVANILKEYELLKRALEAEGYTVARTAWDDMEYDWSLSDAAVIRTTWDYYERYDEFLAWLQQVAQKIFLINALETITWNLDKNYLYDLKEKGLSTVPTFFAKKGTTRSLNEIASSQHWDRLIVKPAIGAAAYLTYQLQNKAIDHFEQEFTQLLQERDMLVQPFQTTITERGEASLMVFGGKFTHAILKKAKAGDFRVQDDFGGTVHPYTPSPNEIELAEDAFRRCDPTPVYGRVDIMWDEKGAPMISELELIEPEIWLRNHPEAARVFAKAIKTKMGPV